jgi:hypothetical protein
MILLLETLIRLNTQNHSCALLSCNFIRRHGAVNFVDSFNFTGFKWRSFKVLHFAPCVPNCDLFSKIDYF